MSDAHVFVTLGDISHIECDAWMLPTDMTYTVERPWRDSFTSLNDELIERSRSADFSAGIIRATPAVGWDSREPLPVLTAVPMHGLRTPGALSELGDAVSDFVSVAARATAGKVRRNRPKRLFAMPSFGTAGGGGATKRGEILDVLLRQARNAATEHDVDVVLVLCDEHMFALAQQVRKDVPGQWSVLGDNQLAQVKRLAGIARSGKLVPFMGAGVSVSAGGPTWSELIERLAVDIGMGKAEVASLLSSGRSALDQAAYLRELYRRESGDSEAFGNAVARAVRLHRYGLAPALLASLRTEQAITLNYDTLFESASADAHVVRTVIPADGSPSSASDSWLLKLHGSVRKPESIVLTRDDYLGYSANREALSAIVKANLITHHLLFVGFGLADDHFHQIIHDVRRAIPATPTDNKLGTALTMQPDELDETLWNEQLGLVVMGSSGDDIPHAGRRLEIFLDALLAYATDSHSYLLHDDFASSLTDQQQQLRAKVLEFEALLTDQDRSDAAWPVIAGMLEQLGRVGS